MITCTVSSLSEYIDQIEDIKNQTIDQIRQEDHLYGGLLFRGQSRNYALLPSIYRKDQHGNIVDYLTHEKACVDLAQNMKPELFKINYRPTEVLALMQHFSIPTRLLDVTENALVALYFACSSDKNMDDDGYVYVFHSDPFLGENYHVIEGLAHYYELSGNLNFVPLSEYYDKIFERKYFPFHQQYFGKETREEKEKYIKRLCDDYLFISAPVRSGRQENQSGKYILFTNSIVMGPNEQLCFEQSIKEKHDSKHLIGRIQISHKNKTEILETLKYCGITEHFVFPDQLDALGKEIKSKVQFHFM